jgi:hypothetical protein
MLAHDLVSELEANDRLSSDMSKAWPITIAYIKDQARREDAAVGNTTLYEDYVSGLVRELEAKNPDLGFYDAAISNAASSNLRGLSDCSLNARSDYRPGKN